MAQPPDAILQNMFAAQNEFSASLAELGAQEDIAEALFGIQLQAPYIGTSPTEADLKDPNYLERKLKADTAMIQTTDPKKFFEVVQKRTLAILKSQGAWAKYCTDSNKALAARISQ